MIIVPVVVPKDQIEHLYKGQPEHCLDFFQNTKEFVQLLLVPVRCRVLQVPQGTLVVTVVKEFMFKLVGAPIGTSESKQRRRNQP